MSSPPNIVPPFRAPLISDQASENGSGQTTTSRAWYLFFENLSRTLGIQSGMVSQGTHQDRLAASTADLPDGALWLETGTGGGGMIYQVRDGKWYYVAGTAWGTLSPDQRPTYLTANDAGYDWRSIDTNTDYAPRGFLWSGTDWVEITQVLYGTHAARPPANRNTPARTLYVETDRGNVVYQNQGNQWLYVAGTMSGPDASKPAGLGTNDAGFRYWATDAPESRWTGSAWASGGGQTPWLSDIDGANHKLSNASAIGIGTSITPTPLFIREGLNQCVGFGATSGLAAMQVGNDAFTAVVPFVYSAAGHYFMNGNVGIGLTNPTYQLQLSSDSAAKTATSTWAVASDVRMKQHVAPVEDDSLALLNSLDWVRFEYNGQGEIPAGVKAIGMSAQQLREHLPEAVRSTRGKLSEDGEETDLLAIDYHHIIVHTARAVRQLAKALDELKQKIGP